MSIETTVGSGTHRDTAWLGLEGARVLVAGAGGIGGACALAYAEAGASVAVVDRDRASAGRAGGRAGCPGCSLHS